MTAFALLSLNPIQLKAETEKSATTVITTSANSTEATKTGVSNDESKANALEAADVAESNANLARLEEIRSMDMSELTPAEKKELREEVHMIQNEQGIRDRDRERYDNDNSRYHRRHGSVVFIGGGGILLILLILLLL